MADQREAGIRIISDAPMDYLADVRLRSAQFWIDAEGNHPAVDGLVQIDEIRDPFNPDKPYRWQPTDERDALVAVADLYPRPLAGSDWWNKLADKAGFLRILEGLVDNSYVKFHPGFVVAFNGGHEIYPDWIGKDGDAQRRIFTEFDSPNIIRSDFSHILRNPNAWEVKKPVELDLVYGELIHVEPGQPLPAWVTLEKRHIYHPTYQPEGAVGIKRVSDLDNVWAYVSGAMYNDYLTKDLPLEAA